MTPTLEAELAELLPCEPEQMCEPPDFVCTPCSQRHWILAFIKRKLAEARADSELLDEVERFLKECSDLTVFEVSGDYFIDDPPDRIVAPTLREALRKLVESES